jgi:hypothetical protein
LEQTLFIDQRICRSGGATPQGLIEDLDAVTQMTGNYDA